MPSANSFCVKYSGNGDTFEGSGMSVNIDSELIKQLLFFPGVLRVESESSSFTLTFVASFLPLFFDAICCGEKIIVRGLF